MSLYQTHQGHGPTLVFLHGWGLNHAVWLPIATRLQHFHLVLVDLPGHGSSVDLDVYSLENISARLQAQIHGPYSILGWSLGGLIALLWASQNSMVERVILVDSTPQFFRSQDWPQAMHPANLDAFGRQLTDNYQATLQRFLTLQSLGATYSRQQIRQLRQAVTTAGVPTRQALQGCLHLLKTVNLRPLLNLVHCPACIIHGENDVLIPAEVATFLSHSLPHAKRFMIKGASHAPFLSHPESFLRILTHYLTATAQP